VPHVRRQGLRTPAALVCSDRAHYANLTVANWLGLGEENVVKVATTDDNQMRIDDLARVLQGLVEDGRRIACVVATMGTTDAFGLDDLAGVVRVRDALVKEYGLDYIPHVHADAVIGWAWSVFTDYDFDTNPHHKTGFTPYISSAVLVKDGQDFHRLARRDEETPYVFQSGERHPGKYALETTRAGGGSGDARDPAGAQRLQPPHLRAHPRGRAAGARRRHLDDRLLPGERVRRADRGAEVVHRGRVGRALRSDQPVHGAARRRPQSRRRRLGCHPAKAAVADCLA
jgi:hypothetical protein